MCYLTWPCNLYYSKPLLAIYVKMTQQFVFFFVFKLTWEFSCFVHIKWKWRGFTLRHIYHIFLVFIDFKWESSDPCLFCWLTIMIFLFIMGKLFISIWGLVCIFVHIRPDILMGWNRDNFFKRWVMPLKRVNTYVYFYCLIMMTSV